MRINGFEQIKAFYSWVFNNPDKVRPTHISLYLFLWNQGNRANWVEWFKCPYDLAMQGACIGNKGTYYRCLDDLQSYGLIKYKKGLNNYKAPQIHLIKLYDNEQVTVPLSEQLSEQPTEQLTELLSGNIYKLITINYKRVNETLEHWLSLDSDKPKDESELHTHESFLLWFKECRKFIGLEYNVKKLSAWDKQLFNELKEYTTEDFKKAFKNFSSDKYYLDNNLIFPKHFLKEDNFIKYLNQLIKKELTLAEKLGGAVV